LFEQTHSPPICVAVALGRLRISVALIIVSLWCSLLIRYVRLHNLPPSLIWLLETSEPSNLALFALAAAIQVAVVARASISRIVALPKHHHPLHQSAIHTRRLRGSLFGTQQCSQHPLLYQRLIDDCARLVLCPPLPSPQAVAARQRERYRLAALHNQYPTTRLLPKSPMQDMNRWKLLSDSSGTLLEVITLFGSVTSFVLLVITLYTSWAMGLLLPSG
jgi:hypothetical protein